MTRDQAIWSFSEALDAYPLIIAVMVIGLVICGSCFLSSKLTKGRLHETAIAIIIALLLAYIGGKTTGGQNGIAVSSY